MRAAAAPAMLLVALVGGVLMMVPRVRADGLPANGGFEDGSTGWAPPEGATLAVDASTAVYEGAAAAQLTATGGGTMTLRSQYWTAPAHPGYLYTLTLAIRYEDPDLTGVLARLDIVDGDGAYLVSATANLGSPATGYRVLTTGPLTAPPQAAYLRVVVTAQAAAAGATLSLDGVVITESAPPPTPTAPPEPPVTLLPPAVPPSMPARTSTPKPTPTSTPTPTLTPTTLGLQISNADFERNLSGWTVSRGRATVEAALPGEGLSMVLHADGAATAWAEQAIGGVHGGDWYEASALLAPRDAVEAGWVRIAWYASTTAGGAQLSTADSLTVASPGAHALSQTFEMVGTGPVQAPLAARSAKVRILVATHNPAGASLVADNVSFRPTDPPPAEPLAPVTTHPTATPTTPPSRAAVTLPGRATATAPAEATATHAATPVATAAALPIDPGVAAVLAQTQHGVRITEVYPDPPRSGRDGDYEWVELTNIGTVAASLDGMSLRDNGGAVVLPALVLPPSASLVLAAPLADVGTATAFRIAQPIGNGLGNSGDHLALLTADGGQADVCSYGDDDTYLVGARIPAPGAGRSIERRFAADGTFRDAVILGDPSPGHTDALIAAADATATPAAPSADRSAGPVHNLSAWIVLTAVAAGLLGGAAVQRVVARLHEDRER